MTLDEFRREMWAYREDADARAKEFKDPPFVDRRLRRLYGSFDTTERQMADVVLCEWVLAPEENVRFDAQNLIRNFKIFMAIPALRQLAERLKKSSDVGAPSEMHTVERLIATLEAQPIESEQE